MHGTGRGGGDSAALKTPLPLPGDQPFEALCSRDPNLLFCTIFLVEKKNADTNFSKNSFRRAQFRAKKISSGEPTFEN